MAKRNKSKKGRRSIGRTATLSGNSNVVKFGSLAGGYLLSNKIQEQIDKLVSGAAAATTTTPPNTKMINAALTAAGLYYLFMFKGKKNLALSAAAGLIAGAAGKGLLVDMGVLSGFGDLPVIGNLRQVPVVSGYNVPSPALNGIGSGYTVPSASVLGKIPDEKASGSGLIDRG